MILKSDDCRKIMDLVKVFDKDFKNNKKGIFVFKNNFVLFDLYKAVIIKTSENVKKEYMFELTNEMIKGFTKYSDIALFEDLDVLQIVIDDKKKTQIICKPLSENDKIVPISSLKRTLERNLGQDDFLELKLELTDKEFTNDLEIMLEIEKLIKEKYSDENSGIELVVTDGLVQFVAKKEALEYINKIFDKRTNPKLTKATMEVLSIIAYNEDIIRAEIENIRGVSSDAIIYKLIEYGLIKESGKRETLRKTNGI